MKIVYPIFKTLPVVKPLNIFSNTIFCIRNLKQTIGSSYTLKYVQMNLWNQKR